MVLMLAIPIRKIYGLEDFITQRHLQNSAKVMLATGLIVAYGYGIEAFMGWYSGNRYDSFLLWNRLHGPYHLWYLALLSCNIFIPQLLVDSKVSHQPGAAVPGLERNSHRHVAGALHHRGGELAPRFPDLFLGHVLPHALGLGGLRRNAGLFPGLHVPVPAHSAHDLDL